MIQCIITACCETVWKPKALMMGTCKLKLPEDIWFIKHIYSFPLLFSLLVKEFKKSQTQLDLFISCLTLALRMLFFHSALCPDSDVTPTPTQPLWLGVKYAGLKIFVYFIQTAREKNAVLGPGVAAYPLPRAISPVPEKVGGWTGDYPVCQTDYCILQFSFKQLNLVYKLKYGLYILPIQKCS